jgi:hypothetical protein
MRRQLVVGDSPDCLAREISLYQCCMSLLPFSCSACDNYWLQGEHDVDQNGSAPCECGGVGRAISMDSYEATDASLFSAIVDSLHIAQLSSLRAGRLLLELETHEEMSPAAKLSRMSELLPSLCIIELIATARAETAHKAIRMFVDLLEAMASKRSASDVTALLEHRAVGSHYVGAPRVGNGRRSFRPR